MKILLISIMVILLIICIIAIFLIRDYKKMHNYKNPFFIVLLLLSGSLYAQPSISFEAGSGLGINADYVLHNVDMKIGGNVPYTRKSTSPHILFFSTGYDFGNEIVVTPSIGIADYGTGIKKGCDVVQVNKSVLLTSLEVGKNFATQTDHYGRFYLYARNAAKTFYGIGLKIFIK